MARGGRIDLDGFADRVAGLQAEIRAESRIDGIVAVVLGAQLGQVLRNVRFELTPDASMARQAASCGGIDRLFG